MFIRDVSIDIFISFIDISVQWDSLTPKDAYRRLLLLADYFAEETGIQFETYLVIAWKNRFKEMRSPNGNKISRENFIKKLVKDRKKRDEILISGEAIYDQFWISLKRIYEQGGLLRLPQTNKKPRTTTQPATTILNAKNTGNSILDRMLSLDLKKHTPNS